MNGFRSRLVPLLGACLVLSAFALWISDDPGSPRPANAGPSARATASDAFETAEQEAGSRESTASQPSSVDVVPAPFGAAVPSLQGRVVDPYGIGVAGLTVHFVPDVGDAEETVLATTDSSGAFASSIAPQQRGRLTARGETHVTVVASPWSASDSSDLAGDRKILVAPRERILGHVRTAGTNAPVAGAAVRLGTLEAQRARWGAAGIPESLPRPTATTDSDGRFALEGCAAIGGQLVSAEHPDYVAEYAIVAPPFTGTLALELAPRAGESVDGLVVDVRGLPIEDALVAAAGTVVTTSSAGKFSVGVPEGAAWPSDVIAFKRGFLPSRASIEAPQARAPGLPLTLVLTPGTLEISGTVEHPDGRACESAIVRVWDGTHAGVAAERIDQIELTGAVRIEDELGASLENNGRTDAAGAFRLRGLLERDYALVVVAPDLRTLVREGVPAGTFGVRLVLPDEPLAEVTCRVVDRAGEAVPDADVSVRAEIPPARTGRETRSWPAADSLRTDSSGAVRVTRPVASVVSVGVRKRGYVPILAGALDVGATAAECTFVLHRSITMSISCPSCEDGSRFELLDAGGAPQPIGRVFGDSTVHLLQDRLRNGESAELQVSDAVTGVRLTSADGAVRVVPIEIGSGETRVRVNL